jgi:hypothetical protein
MQILIVIHMPKVFRAFNIPPCVSLDPRLDEWSNEEQEKKKKSGNSRDVGMDHHSVDNRSSSTARNQGKQCEQPQIHWMQF